MKAPECSARIAEIGSTDRELLTKPFEMDALSREIREVIGEK